MKKNYRKYAVGAVLFSLALLLSLSLSFRLFGQSSSTGPLVTQAVNENLRVQLPGGTHPLARAEFDQGPVPDTMPVAHRFLVLNRPQDVQAALDQFRAGLTNPSSANYHQLLTAQEFGQRFGAAQSDIDAVTAWLASHGITNVKVANDRDMIDFSGTAAQVNQAFQTSIHYYSVRGKQYWAASSVASIPAALSSLVDGVYPLHNFPAHPAHRVSSKAYLASVKKLHSAFTYEGGCDNLNNCYALGPGDFAKIYNLTPLWNAGTDGSEVTIAVIGQSNINNAPNSTGDIYQFRSQFGLNPNNLPTVTCVNGCPSLEVSGDEGESDLDVEWAGAVAPNATINLVTSPANGSLLSSGIAAAAEYAVDNDVAPIVSLSYDLCEADLQSSNGNSFFNTLWGDAQSKSISVIVAAGDSGSAACDYYDTDSPYTYEAQPAEGGLAVSGLASTPFDIAVGGTDFDQFVSAAPYWLVSSNTTLDTNIGDLTNVSATGYIPETTWNTSCTNYVFSLAGLSANPVTNCNDTADLVSSQYEYNYIVTEGGGGGASSVYAKPTWQVGPGVPADGHRDVPDVSMFAGNGLNYSFYTVCEQDSPYQDAPCNLADGYFLAVGGTSASAQVFAGIMALVVQEHGPQSNPNATLYKLAETQQLSACNSSTSPSTGSPCIFYDVTNGTNAQPCEKASTDCGPVGTENIGILTGYSSTCGYDLTTGLGSVNAANLVNKWTNTTVAAADFDVCINNNIIEIQAPGDTGTATVSFVSTNSYTGNLTLTVNGLPEYSSGSCSPSSIALAANSTATCSFLVSTAGTAKVLPVGRNRPFGISPFVLALATMICLVLLFSAYRKQIRWSTAFGFLAVGMLLVCGACGGGGGSSPPPPADTTPAGYYTGITVSVTDGTTTHTVPIAINVE